ncbi:MAG: hypothetical protein AB8X26_06740 [Francisella endosymbiont of Hyalomma asiaticum]
MLGFFVFLVILSGTLYLSDESFYTKSIILVVAISTMMQSFNVLDFYFQSQVKGKFVALANNLFNNIINYKNNNYYVELS